MRRLCSYRNQIIVLGLWIVIVIVLFKLIQDRRAAAFSAGIGFVLWPSVFLISELLNRKSKLHVFMLTIFLLFSALPIFLLRVLNWDTSFSDLKLFGFPAAELHKYSNFLYVLMLMSAIYHYLKYRK